MDKEKKSYFFNVIEAKDGKMAEVMDFNFGGHHDLAAMAERVRAARRIRKRQTRQGIRRSDATSPPRA